MSAQPEPIASMTDEQREQYISECAERVCACMDEWSRAGCFDARAEADVWRRRMERAINERSAEAVRRMEVERNLT